MKLTSRLRSGLAAIGLAAVVAQAQPLTTQLVASGLNRPVGIAHARGDASRLYVVQQPGQIRLIKNGVVQTTNFLNIQSLVTGGTSGGDERGLLGLAFAPDYNSSGKFYVNYTGTISGQLRTVIAEYRRSTSNPDIADPTTARILLTIPQPFSNHNGGWMGFSPIDGYLYISTGDGGSGNDPLNNGSNLNSLLGKMLRIDVSDDSVDYIVPDDNPFARSGGRAEIWAYGLRNPWRCGFDRLTGDLWIGDVGQNAREEINFQPASSSGAEHYGWRCREGFIATPGIGGCPSTNPQWVDPVFDYNTGGGNCSVVSGPGYRGCELGPAFVGRHFFTDYCGGALRTLDPANNFAVATHLNLGFGAVAIGEDARGELYIAFLSGTVRKIVNPAAPDVNGNGTVDLCECRADINTASASNPAAPSFGVPDGAVSPTDFTAFAYFYSINDLRADLNSAGANTSSSPNFGVPDGLITPTDFTAFIFYYQQGCPS